MTSWWVVESPISRMWYPRAAYFLASLCTLVTRGQVASIVASPNSSARRRTAGLTPWAEKTTVSESLCPPERAFPFKDSISFRSSTKWVPWVCSNRRTTVSLCTME